MRNSPARRELRDQFPSSNQLGIPDLLPSMLADTVPEAVEVYGTRRTRTGEGVGKALAFFVDDYRFEAAWAAPNRIRAALVNQGWDAVMEPDFSVWRDRPLVEQQHNVYRSRWCGRFWQEAGIKVVPCLNWSTRQSLEWSLFGVPVGCPIVAVETQTCGVQFRRDFEWGLAAALERIQPSALLLYGDEDGRVTVPGGVRVVRVASRCGACLGGNLHR